MTSGLAVLVAALFLGVPVWRRALGRWKQGRPLIEPRQAPPVSWGAAALIVGFVAVIGVHIAVSEAGRWLLFRPGHVGPILEITQAVPAAAELAGGVQGALLGQVESRVILVGLVATVAGNVLLVALLPLILAMLSRTPRSDLGLPRQGVGRDVAYGLAVAAAMLLPVMLLNVLALLVFPRAPHPVERVLVRLDALGVGLAVASPLVVAPVAEELIYRVFLQGGLARLSTPAAGLVAAAAVFAAAHGPMWPDPVPLFVLALALGYLYRQRKSWPAVAACHAGFNAFNLVIAIVGLAAES